MHYGRRIYDIHDKIGRVVQSYSNDVGDEKIDQTFTYYGTSEIATLASQVGPVAGTRTFNFSYDDQHQLVAADDGAMGYAANFSYTPQGRLKTADVGANVGVGTMVEPRDVTYVYDDADPEILTALDDSAAPLDLSVDYREYDEFDNVIPTRAGNMTLTCLGFSDQSFLRTGLGGRLMFRLSVLPREGGRRQVV